MIPMNSMELHDALAAFFTQHHAAWQGRTGHAPLTDKEGDSPAQLARDDQGLAQWQAWRRPKAGSFDNVEQALELTLHPQLAQFYGPWFAGSLGFDSVFGEGELLQAWNQDDFAFLQENLIGHLMDQKRLNLPLTLFIGVVGDELLVLDNETGAIWLAHPGQAPHRKVAGSLEQLLGNITPKVIIPQPVPEVIPEVGFLARLKVMWGHLWPGRN